MAVVVYLVLAMMLQQATSLPKILCLHGGGQPASGFQAMPGMASLQSSLSSTFEFVFAQTPESGYVWIRDPPGGKGTATTDTNWASASVSYLNTLVQNQGPFSGILGYSQGAAMSIYYLSQVATGTFQFAVLFCGYLPTTHTGLLQSINTQSPFGGINTLVFMGQNDAVITNTMTLDAAAKFTSPTQVTSSVAAHNPPETCDSTFNQVLSFLTTAAGTSTITAAPSTACKGTSAARQLYRISSLVVFGLLFVTMSSTSA